MIVILGQENELREFLKSCTQLGYGKTRKDAMGIVESVAVDKGVLIGTKMVAKVPWTLAKAHTAAWWQYCSCTNGRSKSRDNEAVHLSPSGGLVGIQPDG